MEEEGKGKEGKEGGGCPTNQNPLNLRCFSPSPPPPPSLIPLFLQHLPSLFPSPFPGAHLLSPAGGSGGAL